MKSKLYRLYSFALVALFMLNVSVKADGLYAGENIRINPQYKVSRASDGSVTITSKDLKNDKFRQVFTDFYADLIMETYRKHSMTYMVDVLRKKYYLSEEECRREIKHAVNTLSEWNIFLRDDELTMEK